MLQGRSVPYAHANSPRARRFSSIYLSQAVRAGAIYALQTNYTNSFASRRTGTRGLVDLIFPHLSPPAGTFPARPILVAT